jgi:hypothetical protein
MGHYEYSCFPRRRRDCLQAWKRRHIDDCWVCFTTLEVDTSEGKWVGYQIIYAVGASLSSLTPMMVAQNALPLADIPIGTSMVMFFQILGG